MVSGKKINWVRSLLAGWFLVVLLASVGQAAQVTLTATDMGDGGVALTVSGSFATCTYCCDVHGNSWSVDTGTVSIPNRCGSFGHGSASCTAILDRGTLHGTHTHTATAGDCTGSVSTTTTTTFDNTPSVSVIGPSGIVYGAFDVTGPITFKPTLQELKGKISAYIDDIHLCTVPCFTENCPFSYLEWYNKLASKPHGGPYSVKLIATGGGASAEATGSFSVDKTPTVTLTSPSGAVSGPFNITGTATFRPTAIPDTNKGTISAYIDNGHVGTILFCFTETCQFDYQEVWKKLYDMNHGGPYTIELRAKPSGDGPTATDTGSVTVDKTPTVSVTSPNGTVSGPFDVTGNVTFKPTTSTTKGSISAYIDNAHLCTVPCLTESCPFSYQERYGRLYDMNHGGPYTIKFIATGGGVSAEDTGSFNVDKTPEVTITSPPGGRVKTPFEIAGTATFKPTLSVTKGTITVSINNGNIGTKYCTTETCQYSYQELYGKLYTGSVGTKVTLKLTATGSGASASDEREFYVEDLIEDLGEPTDDPVEPQPPSCAAREQP